MPELLCSLDAIRLGLGCTLELLDLMTWEVRREGEGKEEGKGREGGGNIEMPSMKIQHE